MWFIHAYWQRFYIQVFSWSQPYLQVQNQKSISHNTVITRNVGVANLHLVVVCAFDLILILRVQLRRGESLNPDVWRAVKCYKVARRMFASWFRTCLEDTITQEKINKNTTNHRYAPESIRLSDAFKIDTIIQTIRFKIGACVRVCANMQYGI